MYWYTVSICEQTGTTAWVGSVGSGVPGSRVCRFKQSFFLEYIYAYYYSRNETIDLPVGTESTKSNQDEFFIFKADLYSLHYCRSDYVCWLGNFPY